VVALASGAAGAAAGAQTPAPMAAPPAAPTPAPAPVRADVRVCAGGDVSLGTNLDTSWAIGRTVDGAPVRALPDPGVLLAPVAPLVADARIVLLNVEGAIGDGPAPRKCARRSVLCYALRQLPAVAAALRHLNDSATVVGNVANNHAHDAGDAGLLESRRRLRDAGVFVTGADTLATAVPVGDGDTVAVLGFSPWSIAGVADLDAVRRQVARAAARHGRVIVMMHIGAEGAGARHTPDQAEQFAGENRGNSVAFARAAVAGGASLVIGSGPHVLRAIEWDGRALVAHSLGNLVTYGPFNHSGYNDDGALLCATLAADGSVRDAVLRSTVQRAPGYVRPDPGNRAARDVAELSKEDFPGTGADITAAGEIRPPRP
jgi:poly-gamma-glutamate capsule biosynthesis protein CapA/YwtB (metallophosphatase superfamily)